MEPWGAGVWRVIMHVKLLIMAGFWGCLWVTRGIMTALLN